MYSHMPVVAAVGFLQFSEKRFCRWFWRAGALSVNGRMPATDDVVRINGTGS